MSYAIALVTDNTPESLEYKDYQGYVVIDGDNGQTLFNDDGWAHADSFDAARAWIAADAGVTTDRVLATRATPHDHYPDGLWDVTIES